MDHGELQSPANKEAVGPLLNMKKWIDLCARLLIWIAPVANCSQAHVDSGFVDPLTGSSDGPYVASYAPSKLGWSADWTRFECLDWGVIMYFSICREVVKEYLHRIEEEGNEEEKEKKLPKRCRSCSDLPNCDLDYCLHWWH